MTGEVSPAGTPGKPVQPDALRASHEDRDGVVEQLRVAAGDGRLTADELDERLERALSARTYGELAVLTADLPAAAGAGPLDWPLARAASALEPAPEPRELVRIECGSGDVKRTGAWTVPQRMDITVTSGSVRLDFTQAVITGRTLRIDADVHSGHLQLVTRPGIVIEADDVAIRSGHVHAPAAWAPGVPDILRVEIAGRVSSGSISARPPRRSLWQWLRRAPRPYAEALLR